MSNTKPRVAPVITLITDQVPMPERKRSFGSKSLYPFDELTEKGQSFGVMNKDASQLATIISSRNRKSIEPVLDTKGKPVMKMIEAKDKEGKPTLVPGTEPEMKQVKKFYAVNVDPATDPAGASCRVFREL